MNRQRFLAELTQLLAFMTPHDRAATIRELTERFDEAGLQGEGAIIASLGTPTAMAIRLAREYVPTPAPVEPEPVEAEDKPVQSETVSESGDEQISDENAEAAAVPDADAENVETAPDAEPENISEENDTDTEAPEPAEESEGEKSEEKNDDSESDTDTPDAEKSEAAETLIEDIPPDEKIPTSSMSSVPEAQRVLSPEISALFGIDSSTKIELDDDDDGERKPNGRAALNLLTVCGGLVLLCVTLIMCAVLFAPGAVFGGVTFLSVIAGIWAAPVFADALYLYGIAVMALALALLFLFLAVWALVAMVKPLVQDIRWLYKLTGGERE